MNSPFPQISLELKTCQLRIRQLEEKLFFFKRLEKQLQEKQGHERNEGNERNLEKTTTV